jgi:hypothetical protein
MTGTSHRKAVAQRTAPPERGVLFADLFQRFVFKT